MIVEFIKNVLGEYGMLITITTIMIIAFARCITKIFRMGVLFNNDLATKAQLQNFEAEVRKDMRGYAIQIQESVIKSVMVVVDSRLKDIDDAKKAAVDIRVTKAELEAEIRNALSKFDDIKTVGDSVRQLNTRVQRLEYGATQQTFQNMPERRNN